MRKSLHLARIFLTYPKTHACDLPQKDINQLQPKFTSQISHVEQSCRFTIPANASKLQGERLMLLQVSWRWQSSSVSRRRDGNQSQDEIKSLGTTGARDRRRRPMSIYKYPGDGNQRLSLKTAMAISPKDQIRNAGNHRKQEIDEDDPCYYKYPGDGNQAQSQDGDGNQSQDEIKSWYDRSKRRPTSPDAITIWRWQCIESHSGEK